MTEKRKVITLDATDETKQKQIEVSNEIKKHCKVNQAMPELLNKLFDDVLENPMMIEDANQCRIQKLKK